MPLNHILKNGKYESGNGKFYVTQILPEFFLKMNDLFKSHAK